MIKLTKHNKWRFDCLKFWKKISFWTFDSTLKGSLCSSFKKWHNFTKLSINACENIYKGSKAFTIMNEVQQIKATTVIECIIDFIIDLNLQKFLSCHQNYSENRWDFGHSKWPCSSFVVPACYEWYPPWFLSDYAECWSHKGQTWELLFSKKYYRRSMCGLYGSQHWKSILYGNNLRINLCLDKASALETWVDSAEQVLQALAKISSTCYTNVCSTYRYKHSLCSTCLCILYSLRRLKTHE